MNAYVANNHGSETEMQAFWSNIYASYIRFPLSTLPSDATITNATLSLYISQAHTSNSESFDANRITANWDESTLTSANLPSVDTSSTYKSSVEASQSTGWLAFTVTDIVNAWYANTIQNYGWRLAYQAGAMSPSAYHFYTSEYGNASLRPKLTITYSLPSSPSPSPSPSPSQTTPSPSPSTSGDDTTVSPSPATITTSATPASSSASPSSTIKKTPSPRVSTSASVRPSPNSTPSPEVAVPLTTESPSPTITKATPAPAPSSSTPTSPWQQAKAILSQGANSTAAAVIIPSIIAAVGPTAGLVALNTFQALANLPSLLTNLWIHFLFLIGIKKRRLPWGRVLNSATDEPIAHALVTLSLVQTEGNLKTVERVTTDQEGRYGFLVTPGNYVISVQRTGYVFPTQILKEAYAGHAFRLNNEKTLTLDLFCDPIEAVTSWSTSIRRVVVFLHNIRFALLILGTGLIIYRLTQLADIFTIVLAAMYLGLWTSELLSKNKGRHTIKLVDDNKKPLPFTVFRLYTPGATTALVTKVTDSVGEAYVLVPGGNYTIQIPSPRHPTGATQKIDLPKGIAHRNMIISVDY